MSQPLSVYRVEQLYSFISTGDQVAMYTLRIMCRYHGMGASGPYSYNNPEFVKILSNDKAKAESLAVEISADYGVEFRGNADFELNEIRRQRDALKAEEIAEVARIQLSREKEAAEQYDRVMNEGIFISGKYAGQTAMQVADIDLQYVFWLADQASNDKSIHNANAVIAFNYIHDNNVQKPAHVGSVGDVIEGVVTVLRKSPFEGMYGTSWVMTCRDSDNNIYSFFTTSRKLLDNEVGSEIKIKATIKEHSEYGNFPQNMLRAPKIVK